MTNIPEWQRCVANMRIAPLNHHIGPAPDGGDASGEGATAAPALGSMRWIMDTGSGYDLIARSHLTVDDEEFIGPTRVAPLYTANGWTHATEQCIIQKYNAVS